MVTKIFCIYFRQLNKTVETKGVDRATKKLPSNQNSYFIKKISSRSRPSNSCVVIMGQIEIYMSFATPKNVQHPKYPNVTIKYVSRSIILIGCIQSKPCLKITGQLSE